MSRRRTFFLGAVLLQVGVLALVAAREEWNLLFGTRVELEVIGRHPVDPIAGPFRGIELAIERLPRSLGRDEIPPAPGDRIHVLLRSGENGHVAYGYTRGAPSPESDVSLTGTVTRVDDDEVRVDYGFDRYAVPAPARWPGRRSGRTRSRRGPRRRRRASPYPSA
ncbi:MAG: GDYXXLXY domain-containing protein, partial [Planctomycetota bacterium JB042]